MIVDDIMAVRLIKFSKYLLSALYIYRVHDFVRYLFGVPYFYDIFIKDNSEICIIAPYYSLHSFKRVTCYGYTPNIIIDPEKGCVIVTFPILLPNRHGLSVKVQLKKNWNIFFETLLASDKQVRRYQLAIATLFKYEVEYISEWIEYHARVGVEHFYIYDNNDINYDRALRTLQPFIQQGLVTYIKWPYPYRFYNFKIRNLWPHDWYGYCQTGQLNHVLYKFGFQSKWILLCDVDEYFYCPKTGRSITETLNTIEWDEKNTGVSSFIIKGKWFGGRPEDVIALKNSGVLKTFTRSESGFTSPAKYILNTDIVTVAGVHSAISKKSGADIDVPPDILMFNHYRSLGWKKRIDQNFATEVENKDIIRHK